MAVRGAARWRPLSGLGHRRRTGISEDVLSKLLRALIDPSVAPVRALPRDERELFIAASNGHVLAFDNSQRPAALAVGYPLPAHGVPVGCSPIIINFAAA